MDTTVDMRIRSGALSGRPSFLDILGALVPLMIGSVFAAEMIAHWGFRTQAGWLGVLISAGISAALTFSFRHRINSD
jgi:hypothetical protein